MAKPRDPLKEAAKILHSLFVDFEAHEKESQTTKPISSLMVEEHRPFVRPSVLLVTPVYR
jgi:hypothetical protein